MLAEPQLQKADGELFLDAPADDLVNRLFLCGLGCIGIEGKGTDFSA